MKIIHKKKKNSEIRAEYDFSKAERGKFYHSLEKGYTVCIYQKDGTITVNQYTLGEIRRKNYYKEGTTG